LRALEEKKLDMLKDRNMFLAERAKLMSLEKINASLGKNAKSNKVFAKNYYVFPERSRVIHVKTTERPRPFSVSLKMSEKKQQMP
jgi:hypothetical protein